MAEIRGKAVIVTGASSGIGEASAREFGKHGASVVLAARRVDRLEALAKEINGLGTGARAVAVPADLGSLGDIQRLVDETIRHFGRIDVLFNNAGFGRLDWLEALDPVKDIRAQFDVNVLGVIQTTREALPAMMRQRSGHVINMSSVAGLVGAPTYTAYAASKFAVRGFSEALRREVAPWGIKVSVVYPGGVKTEFASHAGIRRKTRATTPKRLVLTGEDVAKAVVGLVRRPRATLVLPRAWWFSILLNQAFPGVVDYLTVKRFTIPEREEELKSV